MLRLETDRDEEAFHMSLLELPETCALLVTQNGFSRAISACELTEIIDLKDATVVSVIDLTTYRSEYQQFLLAYQNAKLQLAKGLS